MTTLLRSAVYMTKSRGPRTPLRNAIQDWHDWRQMTIERYLLSSAEDEGREPPQDRVDETKVALEAQQQQ